MGLHRTSLGGARAAVFFTGGLAQSGAFHFAAGRALKAFLSLAGGWLLTANRGGPAGGGCSTGSGV